MELLSTIKCNYIEFHTLLCYSQSIVFNVCDDVLGHVSANLLAIVINYVSVIKGDE
jgi:hypothetical protein